MMRAVYFLFSCILFFLFVISCRKGKTEENVICDSVSKTFSADVNPIVQSFCNQASCHHSNSALGPGPLTNYTQVFNARVAVRTAISSGRMPFGSSLSPEQKNKFLCWIDSGAPDN